MIVNGSSGFTQAPSLGMAMATVGPVRSITKLRVAVVEFPKESTDRTRS